MKNWRDRLTSDPNICGGQVCISGTRVMISVILDNLAEGQTIVDILSDYPTIVKEDILAAIHYASLLSKDEIAPLS